MKLLPMVQCMSGMSDVNRDARLHRLIAVGRSLVAGLDLDAVLPELLSVARELTGARYAAIGVLDAERREIERFLTQGVDARTHADVGDPPRGRGILGLLIEDPRPLRLHDLRAHPRSYGFPAAHPRMHSFLGVPILVGGEAWGNLYLTEKRDGDFDGGDEEIVTTLAGWAAIAIEHARVYERWEERQQVLERIVRSFEAAATITRAVGSDTDVRRVLELIVKRGRALVDARALVIVLRDEEDFSVAAGAGEVDPAVVGRRIPVRGANVATILREIRTERSRDVAGRLRIASGRLGVPITSDRLGVHDPQTALIVPLEFRSRRLGALIAFDRVGEEIAFDGEQQALLLAFAASAATEVATAQSVERQRLRDSLASAERERTRWAHELHDETLQALAGFRVTIDAALANDDPDAREQALRTLGERTDAEIAKLRALIADLRPAVLDTDGLKPAIERLAQHVAQSGDLAVDADVQLDGVDGDGDGAAGRLAPATETAIYRVVQEALTNVVKHAHASRVAIEIAPRGDGVEVIVRDDGAGFDPDAPRDGYGIAGMAERAELADGTLSVTSRPGAGTTVQAWLHAEALPA